jgi:hypothetical protein
MSSLPSSSPSKPAIVREERERGGERRMEEKWFAFAGEGKSWKGEEKRRRETRRKIRSCD